MKSLLDYYKIKRKASEVDFIIPFLDVDRRYFIDPSLIRNSTDPFVKRLNEEISEFIKLINNLLGSNRKAKLHKLLNIGEAQNAGLGYCETGIDGSGIGTTISANLTAILRRNPQFAKRGLERLEELQWLDMSVGPDRISDLSVHILKRELIKFTQNNCRRLGIPMEEVRLHKVFDHDEPELWVIKEVKLPINPEKIVHDAFNPHPPILLIPKRIVKPLPLFLNYDDFYGFIEKEEGKKPGASKRNKILIVDKVTSEPELSTRYIRHRETEREKLKRPNFDSGIFEIIDELEKIKIGKNDSHRFKVLVGKLLDAVFDDLELIATEKQTLLKDSSRDIILRNNSGKSFLVDIKNKHRASYIIVDTKNTLDVTAKDIKQVASYLNDDLGRFGIIVSHDTKPDPTNATYRILKEDKKVIIFVTAGELIAVAKRKFSVHHISGESDIVNELKLLSRKYDDLMIN